MEYYADDSDVDQMYVVRKNVDYTDDEPSELDKYLEETFTDTDITFCTVRSIAELDNTLCITKNVSLIIDHDCYCYSAIAQEKGSTPKQIINMNFDTPTSISHRLIYEKLNNEKVQVGCDHRFLEDFEISRVGSRTDIGLFFGS